MKYIEEMEEFYPRPPSVMSDKRDSNENTFLPNWYYSYLYFHCIIYPI